jgi:hypothetical protein
VLFGTYAWLSPHKPLPLLAVEEHVPGFRKHDTSALIIVMNIGLLGLQWLLFRNALALIEIHTAQPS